MAARSESSRRSIAARGSRCVCRCPQSRRASAMDVPATTLRTLKILVIDDEENHARATAEILERVGYNVTIATSGETGLKTLKADRFNIIITDLNMNPVNGLEI